MSIARIPTSLRSSISEIESPPPPLTPRRLRLRLRARTATASWLARPVAASWLTATRTAPITYARADPGRPDLLATGRLAAAAKDARDFTANADEHDLHSPPSKIVRIEWDVEKSPGSNGLWRNCRGEEERKP